MRIGVNVRLLLEGRLEGIGYFAEQILKRMVEAHPEVDFIFFFDRKPSDKFLFAKNVKPVVLPIKARHPILWKIYFHYLLPFYCRKEKVDVFFSPENYIPILRKTPTICTMHDINFVLNPEFISDKTHRRYFLKYFPMYAEKSDKIITVSQFSKDEIVNYWGMNSNKIDVVYNAANDCYRAFSPQENREIKERFTQGKDFFYFVGAIHKRKNLDNMFRAFDLFKQRTQSDVKFVVIGNKKWWDKDIDLAYNQMQYKDDLVFTGRLEAEQVAGFASASIGLMFATSYEGFGIPIVEAFQSRTAVITSNITSMPEVAADAALMVSPNNTEEIAQAMQRLYQDKALRDSLIAKGLQRNKQFNWTKSSEELWRIIEQML